MFLFGIPHDESEQFVHEMLAPFGSISKISFDLSPDGIDRKIGHRFLNKPRVYTLYYFDPTKQAVLGPQANLVKVNGLGGGPGPGPSAATAGGVGVGGGGGGGGGGMDDDEFMQCHRREEMIFKTSYEDGGGKPLPTIKCHKCGKVKTVSEGFYTTSGWQVIYCSQCAAQLAEDQLNLYYKERNVPQYQHYPRPKWLGAPPADHLKRRTALVVFASQRQASKCAYVRTRIAHRGAFATHFHHYSKVKKEVVLSESDQNPNEHAFDGNANGDDNKSPPRGTTAAGGSTSGGGGGGGHGDGQKKGGQPTNRGANAPHHAQQQQQQQQQGMRGGAAQRVNAQNHHNRGGPRGGMRALQRGYSGNGGSRRGNFQQNRGRGGRGSYGARGGGGGGQRGGYAQRAWGGNQLRGNAMYPNQGGGGRGGPMMGNQPHYANYGQPPQQGPMYGHSQNQQKGQRPNMKGPGLYRQSSAPTTSRQ